MKNSPESIVVSLEWSKKLKEAGYRQRARFLFWIKYCDNPKVSPDKIEYFEWGSNRRGEVGLEMNGTTHLDFYAAPTAEEILRELPDTISIGNKGYSLSIDAICCGENEKTWTEWEVCYQNDDEMPISFIDVSIANAAACMYCHLAENNLLPTQKHAE